MNSGPDLTRRGVLAGAAAIAVTPLDALAQTARPIPIIDSHIHLFDPARRLKLNPNAPPRPAGSWWNTDASTANYRSLATKHGVVGAIEIEASRSLEEAEWVLQVSEADQVMVGTVGSIPMEAPDFAQTLERFHRNPLFRGIRRTDIGTKFADPAYIAGAKVLAAADLALDVSNPSIPLLEGVVRLSDAVPGLRIIIDHLPQFDPTPEQRPAYDAAMREFRKRPQIYTKLSAIIHQPDDKIGTKVVAPDLANYRPRVDEIYDTFGEDRVLFGSDWPHCDEATDIDNVFRVAKQYFAGKTRAQQEKYFWRNSIAAYKWVRRNDRQPRA